MSARTLAQSILVSALLGAAASNADAVVKLGQERFAGRGTRGPYMLAFQGVEARSEQIYRNGIRLERERDYLLDSTIGMVSFTEPLRPEDSVEVRYEYDTDKAKAPGPANGSFGLFGGNSGGLALTYNFKPDTRGNQTLTSLGFNGQAETGSGLFTTNFMLDKTAGPKAGRDAQNMQLALKRDTGRFKYDLGYARVGSKFSQADAMKLLKGSEALNLAGSLQFSKTGMLSFKRSDTLTPDAKKGALDAALTQAQLNMDLASGSKLTALHERQTQTQGGTRTESAVDRLQLDQKLGGKASATLVQETVTSGKNGQTETVDATRLNATMTGDNGLKVETALAMTDSDKKGDARDAALKLQHGAGATKLSLAVSDRQADAGDLQTHAVGLETTRGGLKFNAAVVGDKTDKGSNETSSLGIAGKAGSRLDFTAGLAAYSGQNKDGTGTRFALAGTGGLGLKFSASRADEFLDKGDKSATNVALDLTGIKRIKIGASLKDDTMGAKPVESQRLNIEANPLDSLKVTATHASDLNEKVDAANSKLAFEAKPVESVKLSASLSDGKDKTNTSEAQFVGIEAQPGKSLKVSASLTDGKINKDDTAIREASIAMTPVKDRLSLSGSFREEERGSTATQVIITHADVKPVDALAMKGFYKQRDTGAAEQINTVDAQITLKSPNDYLQMIGTFSQNPEEKDKVLRLVRRGLTLQSKVGALTFSGGYITEESLVDDAEGAHTEFKLGLRFNKYASLTGGYLQTVGAIRGYKPMLAYNMKYDHNIGKDFHLLLQGDVVEREEPTAAEQRQEVKGTANLGFRF